MLVQHKTVQEAVAQEGLPTAMMKTLSRVSASNDLDSPSYSKEVVVEVVSHQDLSHPHSGPLVAHYLPLLLLLWLRPHHRL